VEGTFEAKSFIEIEAALSKESLDCTIHCEPKKLSHNHRRGPNASRRHPIPRAEDDPKSCKMPLYARSFRPQSLDPTHSLAKEATRR
jgi:hypothetical protein